MDELIEIFQKRLARVETNFVRSFINTIQWNSQLIGIKGARGVGKTTLLLQYIKINLANNLNQVLYVSLDNIWFNNNSLTTLVKTFEQKGGKYLFLDEVHKYPQWSQELKTIYDNYPDIKVVFTGSSLLEILNAQADLSRRAIIYTMQGLSFREFLAFETNKTFAINSLDDILNNHTSIATNIHKEIKVFQHFDKYLKIGYYPFYKEEEDLYQIKLAQVVNMMLDVELPLLRKVDIAYIPKVKQLLSIIAASVPFQANVSKLSDKIGINRNTLLTYFHYLEEIGLTKNLFKQNIGISILQKPVKTYLENTNLMYLLASNATNKGNIRESFFINQLAYKFTLNDSPKGDFLVNDTHTFEIGGKHKTENQIKQVANAYVVLDDVEIGNYNRIPLWLFGFLY